MLGRIGARSAVTVGRAMLCVIALAGVAGCGSNDASSSANQGQKGKKILIVTPTMAAVVDSAAAEKIQQAAKSLGWSASVCDGKADPSNFPKCMNQAIAEKADGVISIGMDCALMKPQLQAAIKAGIKVVGMFGWDCSQVDPSTPPLMTRVSFGDRFPSEVAFFKNVGRQEAAYITVKTNGKANVIYFGNKEFQTLKFLQDGYLAGMSELCPGCQEHDVDWLGKELGPPLQTKAQAALLKYPDANAVFGNTNPELGPSAAIVQAGKQDKLAVVGGLGIANSFDDVRNGKGLNAVPSFPGGWYAYAAVDTLNSLLAGTQPRDEGIGSALIDAQHGLPAKGSVKGYWDPPNVDYVAAYENSWGVGS
jgi:ribose transport system substrate-binding protein